MDSYKSQGSFNQGYDPSNQGPHENQANGIASRQNLNRPNAFHQGPRGISNLPFPPTQPLPH